MKRGTFVALVVLLSSSLSVGTTATFAAKPPVKKRLPLAPGAASGAGAAPATDSAGRDDALPPSASSAAAAPADAGASSRSPPVPPAPEKSRPVTDLSSPPEAKAAPEPKAPPVAPTSPAELDKLRADYDRLREELFRSRARAQLVAEATYPSRLSATLRWKGGADQLIRHAQLRLDGGELWDSGDKPVTDELISVAERGVKPGTHALTVRLEVRPGRKNKDSERLGYTSEHTFAIIVADKVKTRVRIIADEDGDPPEYEPNLEVELETEK